ncbi:MAG: phosphonate ABC transporter, permease protein PhnE [Clostridiales bacterium]|nr:phosphonate ABC transporter, permease protein PhnE [Clostridiales bacterium]
MFRKQSSEVKKPLFDRIFPPRTIVVGGHTVEKPRSRMWLITLGLVLAVSVSVVLTKFDIGLLIRRFYQFQVILSKIFNPKWSYFPKVLDPLLDTIKMSVLGSVIGSVLALPFSIAASANIIKNNVIVAILRVLLNIVRTLPTLVIASISALMFGLGTFAGTVAISIFTFGIVSKMMYESIETVDMGAFEAMEALGSTKFRAFWSSVFPQILPTYLSHCLYSFEINIRAASILGYVGAGGLGILINDRVGFRDYEGLGMVLITLFVVVLIIDNTSQYLRRKLS